jgi:hypothetical protein
VGYLQGERPRTPEFAAINQSLPFLLRVFVTDDDPASSLFSFIARCDSEHPAFQELRKRDEAALQEALLRWAVIKAEERIRSGVFPASPTSRFEK